MLLGTCINIYQRLPVPPLPPSLPKLDPLLADPEVHEAQPSRVLPGPPLPQIHKI
jgi:hypothetical protein